MTKSSPRPRKKDILLQHLKEKAASILGHEFFTMEFQGGFNWLIQVYFDPNHKLSRRKRARLRNELFSSLDKIKKQLNLSVQVHIGIVEPRRFIERITSLLGEGLEKWDYEVNDAHLKELQKLSMPFQNSNPIESRRLIESATSLLSERIEKWDYEICNEAELCHMFFASMIYLCKDEKPLVHYPKAQIPLTNGGSVDLGLHYRNNKRVFDVLIEAKRWIRPLDVSPSSAKCQPTKRRMECIDDANRLAGLLQNGICNFAGLLILERNSNHLRKFLKIELVKIGLGVQERWIDIHRYSNGRRQEHVGLIWINSNA